MTTLTIHIRHGTFSGPSCLIFQFWYGFRLFLHFLYPFEFRAPRCYGRIHCFVKLVHSTNLNNLGRRCVCEFLIVCMCAYGSLCGYLCLLLHNQNEQIIHKSKNQGCRAGVYILHKIYFFFSLLQNILFFSPLEFS